MRQCQLAFPWLWVLLESMLPKADEWANVKQVSARELSTVARGGRGTFYSNASSIEKGAVVSDLNIFLT